MKQPSDSEKPPTTLQTVERALAFLEAVAEARRPPRLKEVAQSLGINVTTSYHLLNTLQLAGYLTRASDGTLRIGGRIAILYQGLVRNFALERELMPVVAELSGSTGETAYIATLNRDKVIIQALVEGDQAVRVTGLYVGFSGSEHIRASGKAVLAHLPDQQRNAVLRQCLPDASAGELNSVIQELHDIRELGCAQDDGRFQEGVRCIAAPFFRPDGSVVGSVAVSVPAARFVVAQERIIDAVLRSALQASRLIDPGQVADHAAGQLNASATSP
jgi:IclR family transcriptional regulator, acetate operon repressor